ncbi:hypothetical protein [Parachryseolinea silvisoli]|uniref:hypothetical protein n=1 Tax=Parachryseolinea silvisoli TaxID=2873601 RepID=UPI002265C612|nr:hypothetical protein [Parachryseolinea silvisoli]
MKARNSHSKSSSGKKSIGSILVKLVEDKKDIEKKILSGDYSGLKKQHKLVQPI